MKKKKHEREKLFDNSDEVFFTLGSLYTITYALASFRLLWKWHTVGYTKTKRTKHPSLLIFSDVQHKYTQGTTTFSKMRPSPI